ncbi:Mucin-6 [Microtus ochrogaster]|uniref:Mucin-6 n=1 Tax=Microtus ochrogaster TaxID=79684 RepID=A0A8J6KR42_MICOH|nr:Mucin-6 [Microtus ochrogaster]
MFRGQQLLLLLFFRGSLINAGLDTTSFASLSPWKLKDSPQTASEKGWCSTWGADHFSTFDHHEYEFRGMCNYIFTATCGDALPTFSIQLRRDRDGNISRIIMELGASVVTVNKAIISVRDIGVVSLPYTSNGLQITPYGQSVQLVAKQLELELVVMWGPDAHLMVLVEKKYMGKLCGLCGNFEGKRDNEFLSEDDKLLEPYKYAVLQKLDDPNEICVHEPIPRPTTLKTSRYAQICNQLLTLVSPGCDVPKESLVLSCQADMAKCAQPGQQNCSCATLSEYSRRCSMAGQPVRNWRTPGLCSVGQCPANQVYQECGEVCVKTCSNPQHSCSSFCNFGCFCPHGTLLEDISRNHTCVPVSQCPCMLNGVIYGPGEITRTACQTCQCTMGRWTCTEQPCPGHCSLEGGSFVTTFDARPYRFHGTCTYTLLQSPLLPNNGTLLAVYDKSGYSHSETSLVSVIYLSKKDKIVISTDEVITNNGDTKVLPYKTHNITIFRQTSTHLQMATTFGLEVVVQLHPVFQAYITVRPQFKGQTRGLCGNFNGDTTDDFTTSMGLDEGTASLFVDSWRAGNCLAALERETDPCSMSQLNKVCAETHCSMLLRKGSVFEKCHTVVNPQPFYKRCVYQACNYEETFPHICSALGAYAHACASRGVLLSGWRSSVDNCTVPCTGNRTFSYNSKACDRTCLSLSDRETECHASAVPVDGCNCPEGTYLNHKAECVHKAQCPCLLDSSKFVQADQSTMINGVICYCINGRLSCPRQAEMFLATCAEPKTFQSCSQSSEDKFGAACAPTCQMLATGIDCVPTKCESGCICPKGLYENSNGQCVPAEECPCDFAGVSYPGGSELHTDCKTCTCSQGRWTCQLSAQCPSTCVLYGEGHVITFDGQRFVFDGNCEYTLATDDCGANSSQPTFKVVTENVICGKSGVTCSRAIKISLGGLSITMADRNYTVSGEEPLVHLQVKPSPLNLVLDVDIPGRLNLTLVWNKHMSVSIKIRRATRDALCGLCGNSNGNMKDDFETRSKYVASSELEFVNSWKENPLCGDASYVVDPCSLNTFRRSWAERKCNIINSQTFAACHSKVYHLPYYEACVRDTCGCDMGGDCECLCDAVAAYAKACLDKGVCVDWRAPDFCPVYCDFYNIHTLVGENEYQYSQEANCTWHYQPCLCPGSLGTFPDTNIEGCYNCSQNEYFDHTEGTCVPCARSCPFMRVHMPHTGSQPTTATPTSTEFHSSSSAATPMGPSNFPGLPTPPPSAPSSTEEVTGWTTPKKSTVSSGEYSPTTVGTTPLTSGLPPTSIPKSTPTRLPVTQATTKPTASSSSSSTKTTAQFTESTTMTPLISAKPGMSTSQAQAPTSQALMTPTASHVPPSPSTTHPPTTIFQTTTVKEAGTTHTLASGTYTTKYMTHSQTSFSTETTSSSLKHPSRTTQQQSTSLPPTTVWKTSTMGVNSSPEVHTTSGTPSRPNTPHISPTVPVSSTIQTTGPPLRTSLQTTITISTPSTSQTASTKLPLTSTSSVTSNLMTMSSHKSQQTLSLPSTSMTLETALPTMMEDTSTPQQTTKPDTYTSSATTQTKSSFSTYKTSTTHNPQTSTLTPSQSTSAPVSSIFTTSTMSVTGTPVVHTTSGTHSSTKTPYTPHSAPIAATSSTTHTSSTTGISQQTTITFPTSSPSLTSVTTPQPSLSTSSVTTSETLNTPTSQQTTSSPPISSPLSTSLQTTVETTGTPHTPTAVIYTTTATTQSQSTFSTGRTSTSHLSPTSSMTAHPSTSVPATTASPGTTMAVTGTSVSQTTSVTPSSPQTPHTTRPSSTAVFSSTIHTTGLPSETSIQTTSNSPSTSGPQTSSTHLPPLSTSSVTPTTEIFKTPTSPHSVSLASTSMPLRTVLPTTLEGTRPYSTSIPVAYTTSAITPPKSTLSTDRTSTALLSQSSSITPTQSTSILPTTNSMKPTMPVTSTPVFTTMPHMPSSANTAYTTHSQTTAAVFSTTHTTSPHSVSPEQSTTTFPTPSGPQTSMATSQPPLSTSSITTSEALNTPTSQQTTSSVPTSRPHSTPLQTTVETTGTPHTPTAVIYTTTATTQSQSTFSTERTSTSHNPQTSTLTPSQSTSAPVSSIFTTSILGVTGTPVVHTTSGTHSSTKTPYTPHSAPTAATSSTTHTSSTTGISQQTTITFPTSSLSLTSVTTPQPSLSTSSVTTSEALNTPTSQQTTSSPPISSPLSTSLQTTVETTGTPHTPTAVIYTTTATTQSQSTFSTERTSTSHTPQTSTLTPSQSTSAPVSSIFTTSTMSVTGTPVVHTTSGTHSSTKTPYTPHSAPIAATSSTTHTSSTTGISQQTTITFPTSSPSLTSVTTPQPSLSTSSVTTSEALNTPTSQQTTSSPPISSPLSTSLQTTVETTGTPHTPTAVIYTTTATTQSQSTFSTGRTSTSHLSPTSSMTVHPSTSVPATTASPGTTMAVTVHHFPVYFPHYPILYIRAAVFNHGHDSLPKIPRHQPHGQTPWYQPTAYNCVPEQPCYYQWKLLAFYPSVTLQTGLFDLSIPPTCFNTDTLQLESYCGCCQPLNTYEKQVSLPCPDPNAPGQQLTLTLQVFSSCACSPLQCKE